MQLGKNNALFGKVLSCIRELLLSSLVRLLMRRLSITGFPKFLFLQVSVLERRAGWLLRDAGDLGTALLLTKRGGG